MNNDSATEDHPKPLHPKASLISKQTQSLILSEAAPNLPKPIRSDKANRISQKSSDKSLPNLIKPDQN